MTDKKVIIFDLDDTLTKSKQPMDSETVLLLERLLKDREVAIIGGASFKQIERQVVNLLPQEVIERGNLLILPMDGGALWQYKDGRWQKEYEEDISPELKKKVLEIIPKALEEIRFTKPEKIYGEQVEDRGSQITFSALGQEAPLEKKEKWSQEYQSEHHTLAAKIQEYLPEMEVKATGLTSIDITQKGIDKKFGIEQIIKLLGVSKEDVLFIGDDFEPDGNDTPARSAGVDCIEVHSIEETKKLIQQLLD